VNKPPSCGAENNIDGGKDREGDFKMNNCEKPYGLEKDLASNNGEKGKEPVEDRRIAGNYGSPINPNRPCKIFIFPIHKAVGKRKNIYEATRYAWKKTERFHNVSDYKYAVGLVKGVSIGSFKIKEWKSSPPTFLGRCEFWGEKIPEFTGFTEFL
jgi:hypothetical protein